MPPAFKKIFNLFSSPYETLYWQILIIMFDFFFFFFFLKKHKMWLQFQLPHSEEPTWNPTDLLPAELPRVIHVGAGLDIAFVRIVDGGGSGVGSSQDEYKTVQAHRRRVFVI